MIEAQTCEILIDDGSLEGSIDTLIANLLHSLRSTLTLKCMQLLVRAHWKLKRKVVHLRLLPTVPMEQLGGVPPVDQGDKTVVEETQRGNEAVDTTRTLSGEERQAADGFGEDVEAKQHTEIGKKEEKDKKKADKSKEHKTHKAKEKKKRDKRQKKKEKTRKTKEKKKDKEKKERKQTEKAKRSKATKKDKKSLSWSHEEENKEDAKVGSIQGAEADLGLKIANISEKEHPSRSRIRENATEPVCNPEEATLERLTEEEKAQPERNEEKPKGKDKKEKKGKKHKRHRDKANKSMASGRNRKSESSSQEEGKSIMASAFESGIDEVEIMDDKDEVVQVPSDAEDSNANT